MLGTSEVARRLARTIFRRDSTNVRTRARLIRRLRRALNRRGVIERATRGVETVAAATWCIAGEAAFPTGGE